MKLKLDTSGKDSVFLSNSHRYYNGLLTCLLYRNTPDYISIERVKAALDHYQACYEAAVNGDRVQIALRNKARKELTALWEKVLHYVQMVAGEDDIPAVLQVGFDIRRPTRRKAAVAPEG